MAGLRYDRRDARRIGLQLLSHSLLFLRLLGRLLVCVLRLPLLFQVVSFALIFRHIYNRLALYLDGVWQPAYPHGWTLWIAFLWSIPVWAAIQIAWTLLTLCVRRRLSRNTNNKSWRVDGYVVLEGRASEEDGLPLPSTPSHSSFPTSPLHALVAGLPSLSTVWVLAQLALYTYLLVVGYHEYTHYEHPTDIRLRPALRAALADPRPNPAGYAPRKEKIFIAAAFHQNQDVIPYWTRSMRDAIIYLGTDNVFVSIVENYSSDSSPDLLRAFAQELDTLGVRNRVLVSDETVKKPEHVEWNPRIEFLAAIRNQALEPLVQSGGYDRVLFSNDIFIEPESILELLATHNGEYDFACGLDFGHFGAYDMWVLRDRIGRLTAGFWPYFFDAASYEAIKREEPVPVFSCWNGIVAFNADPVLPVALRSNKTLSQSPLPNPPPANHPWTPVLAESPALTPPLKFRASAEGECYSSESFLLPYDFRRVMALDRIYANPLVVNGYVWKYYAWHKWVLRERYVKWFIEQVWDGAWMQYARMIVGDAKSVWVWDGVECHPWW